MLIGTVYWSALGLLEFYRGALRGDVLGVETPPFWKLNVTYG